MDGCLDGWVDGQRGGWMDRWADGWMDRLMSGLMVGWMDESLMNNYLHMCSALPLMHMHNLWSF